MGTTLGTGCPVGVGLIVGTMIGVVLRLGALVLSDSRIPVMFRVTDLCICLEKR